MLDSLKQKTSLLVKFSAASFLIMAAIAMLLVYFIQRELKQSALIQAADSAAAQATDIVNPQLREEDFAQPLGPERYAAIDTIIRDQVLRGEIVRVKIWSPEGRIIYSDEQESVGNSYPLEKELEDALAGETAVDMSHLEKDENAGERGEFEHLIEAYVPLKPENTETISGVYEIYVDTIRLEPRIATVQRFVLLSFAAGFLILYASLFSIVRNASGELVRRYRENRELYREEQSRRDEISALYETSRMLAEAAPVVQDNVDIVSRRAVEMVHAGVAGLDLLEEGDNVRRLSVFPAPVSAKNLDLGAVKNISECPLHARVFETKEPVVVGPGDAEILSERERTWLLLDTAIEVCVVPIIGDGRVIGFLIMAANGLLPQDTFTKETIELANNLADQAANAILRAGLFARVEQSYLETVISLTSTIEARDSYTHEHAESMAEMALAVGSRVGMVAEELEDLHYAAILHDIGKIGVPDSVLNKPGRLNEEEWVQMKKHPEIGEQIVSHIPRLHSASKLIRHHHERWAGGGYPDNLRGDEIPLGARIITVIDSYGAMVDKRVYKESMSRAEAIAEIERCAGEQFDPKIAKVFIELVTTDASPVTKPCLN